MARRGMPDTGETEREKSKRVGALGGLAPFLSPYRWLMPAQLGCY